MRLHPDAHGLFAIRSVSAGLLAGFALRRGSYGRGWDVILGLIGGVVLSWVFEDLWASLDPSLAAMIFVATVGAAGLIVAQRTIFPARA
jgi:uncharacterized membrane protein YeaQ/YmgE (transglycosylase-associated protein family)